jgi:hypothetical protein
MLVGSEELLVAIAVETFCQRAACPFKEHRSFIIAAFGMAQIWRKCD